MNKCLVVILAIFASAKMAKPFVSALQQQWRYHEGRCRVA